MTKQVETLIVAGTVTLAGNASVIVTARGMTGSPKTLSVPVLLADTASLVATAVRYALALNTDVAEMFQVSGTGANVILTARVAASNDASLNISIANGTCTGLTAVPTSTSTTPGVSEAAYYISLATFKANRGGFNTEDTGDDEVILSKILDAQKYIEGKTRKVFLAGSDSDRLFTVGRDTYGRELTFGTWAVSIDEVTNGDSETVDATDYVTLPDEPPYFGIKLKGSSGLSWGGGDDPEDSITVSAEWAYTATPPDDIAEAVYKLANYLYESKSSGADLDRQIVTAEGIILPAGVPKFVSDVIASYKSYV